MSNFITERGIITFVACVIAVVVIVVNKDTQTGVAILTAALAFYAGAGAVQRLRAGK